jgi:hypothetical protein
MRALLSLLSILVSLSAQAQVALVTDLSGKAGTLAILSEIERDTRVQLEGGELAVLYYASGDEYRFRGPALIAFEHTAPRVLQGTPPKLAQQPKQVTLKPGGVAPATFVMRTNVSKELRARIEAARPKPGAPVSERVAFAAWLEQLELKDEAKAYWKALAAERPDSAKLKELGR